MYFLLLSSYHPTSSLKRPIELSELTGQIRADVVNLFLGQAQLDNSTKDLEDRTSLENQYTGFACVGSARRSIKEDDDSSSIKFHTKTNGVDYNYNVFWVKGCKSTVTAMNAYKPLPNDSDYNCLTLLRRAYTGSSRAHLSATYLALLSAYIASSITSTVSHSIVTASLDLNTSDEDLRDSHSALSGNLSNHKPAVDQLYRFILRPRSKVIDLNLKEEQSWTTVLHKAAVSEGRAMKTMSVQRTNWNFENGSSNGTLPFPTTGNHNSGSGAGPNVSIQQPILKGYLRKWTNMARAYSTRWLVLEKGYLSYYPDQKDEGKTVRGLIAMSVATVVGPDVTKDRLRFKVSSKLGNSFPRFYLKVAHPLEVMRWVDALKQVIECANYNANNLQPSISLSMNTPTSRLLSASGMSNNERESLGFVNRHLRNNRTFLSSSGGSGSTTDCNNSLASANTVTTTEGFNPDPNSPHGSILATSFTDDESILQEGQTLVGGQALELLRQGLKTHIEMTKSLVESLSFSSSSSQLSRITAGSNPKLSPSEFSYNSSPSGNNSTTSS
ncbi:hypothetical protein PPACK8108_LOCUS10376 [Phakopsora pachyrhizi]|uniref:PH domain-containing protein n=1 Tax=Phakopsora pachyrhizi TaxID=170000 RepID=A0AAV0B002_PHAPC|nr:hypothetical protein PPACK8108_LOCUS10376 [Phakopsora pachyrhizi]